jgi:hypothetical protein
MPFPTPFGGVVALAPLTAIDRRPTQVLQFDDGSEQRFRQSAGLTHFQLDLSEISTDEKQEVFDFFETCKGSFDSTWTITVDAVDHEHIAFAEDRISATQGTDGTWSLTVKLVQTRKN